MLYSQPFPHDRTNAGEEIEVRPAPNLIERFGGLSAGGTTLPRTARPH